MTGLENFRKIIVIIVPTVVSWYRGTEGDGQPPPLFHANQVLCAPKQECFIRPAWAFWRGIFLRLVGAGGRGHRKGGGLLNLHATARKLQTALTLKGRYIKINQFQSYSERAERMVTKFVLSEKRNVEGKEKDVAICSTYSMADVVKTLAVILNDGGDV